MRCAANQDDRENRNEVQIRIRNKARRYGLRSPSLFSLALFYIYLLSLLLSQPQKGKIREVLPCLLFADAIFAGYLYV